MTADEVNKVKEGQELWYAGMDGFPEKVIVDRLVKSESRAELHLIDNCYIPEKDFGDMVFITFEECAGKCMENTKAKLAKLKEMLRASKAKK